MELKNHPFMWLSDAAAASLGRWEDDHGVLALSDAGRTDDEQRELIRRWNTGGTFNRPPYLYLPAWPSPHQSGLALDTPEHERFGETCNPYGWRFNIPSDPVHAIYEVANDQFINRVVIPEIPKTKGTGMFVARNWGDDSHFIITPNPVGAPGVKALDGTEDRNAVIRASGVPVFEGTGEEITNLIRTLDNTPRK